MAIRSRGRPADGRGTRPALTLIYFLLPAGAVSRWHRVRSDEVWHFCEGAPLELLQSDGTSPPERVQPGPLVSNQRPVHCVPAAMWQPARLRANRDVQVAESRVRQARAVRTGAKLDLVPTVTFAAGYTRQRFSQADFVGAEGTERSVYDGGLVASWEVDVFGRLCRNLRGADALSQSAQEDVRDMERIIFLQVLDAERSLLAAQDQLAQGRTQAVNALVAVYRASGGGMTQAQ